MNTPYQMTRMLLCAAALLAACGGESNNGSKNNSANNTQPDQGVITQDMGSGGQDQSVDTPDQAPDEDMTAQPDQGGDPDMAMPDEITYYEHIAPLLHERCNECHTGGSIAPFTLETYEEVKPMGSLLVNATQTGRMPPWPPEAGCGEFQHERKLSAMELALLKGWVDGGMLEGDKANPAPLPPRDAMQLGAPDLTITTGVDYKPTPPEANSIDDYHCFVIDHGLEQDRFLNAFRTTPGNSKIVHHVLLYSVPKTKLDRIAQMEAEDPTTPGYTCFGATRAGSEELLAGWVPGTLPLKYPDNHGIPVKKDNVLILQIHYNTLNDAVGTDQTKVELFFTDPAKRATKLAMVPLVDQNLDIRAGDANAVETGSIDLPIPVKVFGVVPHMHTLGTSIKVTYERQGTEKCMVNVPDWDFNWQGFYMYKEPLVVPGGSKVKITCEYDNSPANQQNGNAPRNVQWGEGTFDEMCLNYVILQDPRP